ncbi:hypothetical protein P43SY_009951 [Pythium insidiosum]|uniref:Pseudouridine synthase RsuA/RluA-like domain-containing protein n=1 Tax=Pythium insidiosum TaxID=114742 RepID=A0AAD5M0H7_PYTIN|nr:hypothetical protein P43SY_009951 [Pythium insidiosum]
MPTTEPRRKRQRCDRREAAGSAAREDDVQQELGLLVQSLLLLLGLPQSLVDSDRALLRLKALPIRVGVGVGVFATDIAVRLYHSHLHPKPTERAGSAPPEPANGAVCDSTDDAEPPPRESLDAFAARAVGLLRDALESDGDGSFVRIQRVSLPDADAQRHGLHPHRILVHTREYAAPSGVDGSAEPLESRLRVVFRDDALLVVDKPADMLSVDGNESSADLGDSVQRVVQQYFPAARMVHRLDYQTSGLLVVALTRTAAQHLSEQFRSRTIEKVYMARVLGELRGDSGTVRVRMARAPHEKLKRCVVDAPDGVETTTHWAVQQRAEPEPAADGGVKSTLVRLRPVTGHTHQLRVHMHHLGHAILGDALYDAERVQPLAPRLLLHAQSISFSHPVTQQRLTIASASTPF